MAGKITVRGKVYRLDLQTHGGDIELDDAEQLRAETIGGSLTVNQRVGDSLIRSGGGDIRVELGIHLTQVGPTCSVRGHGRGLSADASGA
jgi:DUF4097 and DUF4098 domain-containing protein YvlB